MTDPDEVALCSETAYPKRSSVPVVCSVSPKVPYEPPKMRSSECGVAVGCRVTMLRPPPIVFGPISDDGEMP